MPRWHSQQQLNKRTPLQVKISQTHQRWEEGHQDASLLSYSNKQVKNNFIVDGGSRVGVDFFYGWCPPSTKYSN